jgi:hypothetical protein
MAVAIFFEGVEQLSDKFLAWERVQLELESRGTAISS